MTYFNPNSNINPNNFYCHYSKGSKEIPLNTEHINSINNYIQSQILNDSQYLDQAKKILGEEAARNYLPPISNYGITIIKDGKYYIIELNAELKKKLDILFNNFHDKKELNNNKIDPEYLNLGKPVTNRFLPQQLQQQLQQMLSQPQQQRQQMLSQPQQQRQQMLSQPQQQRQQMLSQPQQLQQQQQQQMLSQSQQQQLQQSKFIQEEEAKTIAQKINEQQQSQQPQQLQQQSEEEKKYRKQLWIDQGLGHLFPKK